MCARIRKALSRLRTDQSGQSLIIVALAMTVVIGVAALAIDVGSWYEKNHQTQVAADAAALAAANYCVTSASGSTPCSSAAGSTAAQNVAIAYAAKNGVTLTASQVTVNTSGGTNTVTVKASSVAPAIFAGLFGVHSSTRRANSVAGWKTVTTATPCSSAPSKSDCSAIYAANPACSGSDLALQLGTAGAGGLGLAINGGVHSEGQVAAPNTYITWGTGSPFTVTSNCYTTSDAPSNNGKTATVGASQPWPINYAAAPYFTACTPGVNCTNFTGIANVPSYCTQATENSGGFVFQTINAGQSNATPEPPVSGNVYCSIGTGDPSDPSTWNGSFTFLISLPAGQQQGTASSCTTFLADTFIGGDMTFPGVGNGPSGVCLKPDAFNCVMYSTGTIQLGNSGNFFWYGDIFDPKGTVAFGTPTGGGIQAATPSGMIEAWNVVDPNSTLSVTGDGPVPVGTPGVSSSSSGTDALEQ